MQHLRIGMQWALENELGISQFHKATKVHHADACGDMRYHSEIVRDKKIGKAKFALQVFHQIQNLRLHRHIERGGGLVADQKFRVGRERTGNRNTLPLTAGKLMRKLFCVQRREADLREQFVYTLFEGNGIGNQVMRENGLRDYLSHPPTRIQARIRVLENHLKAFAQVLQLIPMRLCHVDTVENDRTARRLVQTTDDPRNGGFSASGFAHERECFTAIEGEADAIDRFEYLFWLAFDDAVQPGL